MMHSGVHSHVNRITWSPAGSATHLAKSNQKRLNNPNGNVIDQNDWFVIQFAATLIY